MLRSRRKGSDSKFERFIKCVEQSRFSAAAGAEEGEELPLTHLQVHLLQRDVCAEPAADIPNDNMAHCPPPSTCVQRLVQSASFGVAVS